MTMSDATSYPSTASAVHEARRAEVDRRLRRVTGATLRTGNQLRLLQNGTETYGDWLAGIGQATRWIHLENYIFRNDTVGTRFPDAVAERAGVAGAVGVLGDCLGGREGREWFWRSRRGGGVDVRIVSPP